MSETGTALRSVYERVCSEGFEHAAVQCALDENLRILRCDDAFGRLYTCKGSSGRTGRSHMADESSTEGFRPPAGASLKAWYGFQLEEYQRIRTMVMEGTVSEHPETMTIGLLPTAPAQWAHIECHSSVKSIKRASLNPVLYRFFAQKEEWFDTPESAIILFACISRPGRK